MPNTLHLAIFGNLPNDMAYIFITSDEVDEDGLVETWEPWEGENKVILQKINPSFDRKSGPTGPCVPEYSVDLEPEVDPIVKFDEYGDPLPEDEDIPSELCDECKIGGTPGFLQNAKFPTKDCKWNLLLLMPEDAVPFSITLAHGIAYAFISEDGTRGAFMFQCD